MTLKSKPFFRCRPVWRDEEDTPCGDAPLTPSRDHLNQVSVRYFPDARRSLDLTEALSGLHSDGHFVLDAATVGQGQPDREVLRAAFEIRGLPSLVVCGHVPGALAIALTHPKDVRGYGVIDDDAALRDAERLSGLLENLSALLAAASSGEMRSTLRTRRFRKLVWTASSRSGRPIDYLTKLRIRFGVGSTSALFSFDDAGWAKAAAPQQAGDLGGDASFGAPDSVDTWEDDGGAGDPMARSDRIEAEAVKRVDTRRRPVIIR